MNMDIEPEFDFEDNIIELMDENGNTVQLECLDVVTLEEREFAVLLPIDDDQVVILEMVVNEEGQEDMIPVDTEETLMKIFDIFKEHYKDTFHFEG